MASYFRNIPNFEYVNRLPDSHSSSEYIEVKNLFKRGKIQDDIFKNVTYFCRLILLIASLNMFIGSSLPLVFNLSKAS